MLVFEDRVYPRDPRQLLVTLNAGLRQVGAMPPGISRHANLAALLIAAGELSQGLADASFAEGGCETRSPPERAGMALLERIARALRVSWDSGFRALAGPLVGVAAEFQDLVLPERITTKRAEGFAFYALYPETYLAAAGGLQQISPTRVLGIRSIGTALAAVVAEALASVGSATVRPIPVGDTRVVVASGAFTAEVAGGKNLLHAVVDEGPGWSGSSFGAAADWLEDQGVASDQIHFFPSHLGELSEWSHPRHRRRWRSAQRHTVDFAEITVQRPRRPEHNLATWFTDLVGPPEAPLLDLSQGRWRGLHYDHKADWPPSLGNLERRKFLLCAGGRRWLLKFVGLGPAAGTLVERACRLHQAGFSPEVAGYRHGFLLERWQDGARPLHAASHAPVPAEMVGHYLAFRATHFPAMPADGASLVKLWEMARFNVILGLGEHWAAALDSWQPKLAGMQSRVRPIATDNRLHSWEWLVTADGRHLKTDVVDHAASWDLVGCQDLAWDVVGAMIELDLPPPSVQCLLAVLTRSGHEVDPALIEFLTPCYLAFQLGLCSIAADIARSEAERLGVGAVHYRERLRAVLAAG
jgi:hypothetical protein